MTLDPSFIHEPIEAVFAEPPVFSKIPGCPVAFIWRGERFGVVELLREWRSYERRGRMAHNMQPPHAAAASRRGSWGVGRTYFRVRTDSGRVFDLYYDRAPLDAGDRAGSWVLFCEQPRPAEPGLTAGL